MCFEKFFSESITYVLVPKISFQKILHVFQISYFGNPVLKIMFQLFWMISKTHYPKITFMRNRMFILKSMRVELGNMRVQVEKSHFSLMTWTTTSCCTSIYFNLHLACEMIYLSLSSLFHFLLPSQVPHLSPQLLL